MSGKNYRQFRKKREGKRMKDLLLLDERKKKVIEPLQLPCP